MRVLYDYQGFMQSYGGVSRYFVELTRAMRRLGDFDPLIPAFFTDNQYLDNTRTFLTHRAFKGKTRIMAGLNRVLSLRSLDSDFDLFHPTYFNPYFLAKLDKPFVVTVHDMIHELFDDTHVRDDGTAANTRLLCARAAAVIAVSRNTKDDLCRILGVPERKVSVVYHATELRYAGEARLHDRPYLLYVGERRGYKNFDLFAASVAPLLLRRGLDLVCAGGGALTQKERTLLSGLGLADKVVQLSFSDQGTLASLYHFAEAFCYPSLYEGFGIPLLEAFSCGCPVAASSTSCFPEIAGEAAEYFDPRDSSSIEAAVERAAFGRRDELVRLGRERLLLYSWERSAAATLDVYRSVLGAS
jgi:glycosyltransferase involved in cell wall biosynthesis